MFVEPTEDLQIIEIAPSLSELSKERLSLIQEGNFNKMILAAKNSNSVSRKYPTLSKINKVKDISLLPILYPKEVAELCPPKSNDLLFNTADSGLVIRTSGTTSIPRYMYHSWEFTNQVGKLGARGIANLNKNRNLFNRVGNCLLPGDLNGSFSFGHDVFQKLGSLTFPFGANLDREDLINQFNYHKIDTLVGFPSVISDIFQYPNIEKTSIETILFIGESFGENRKREIKNIKPSIGIKALAYSTSETGPIGYPCHNVDDQTFHIHADTVIVEIVDAKTEKPVSDGVEGKILVTALSTTGMALFRYDIGDRGYIEKSACSCGDIAPLLKITGRSNQVLVIDGLNISQDHVMAGLKKLNIYDPKECQLTLIKYKDGSFDITLKLREQYNSIIRKDEILSVLKQTSYHLSRILSSPRLNVFKLDFNNNFHLNNRGKQNFFYQIEK